MTLAESAETYQNLKDLEVALEKARQAEKQRLIKLNEVKNLSQAIYIARARVGRESKGQEASSRTDIDDVVTWKASKGIGFTVSINDVEVTFESKIYRSNTGMEVTGFALPMRDGRTKVIYLEGGQYLTSNTLKALVFRGTSGSNVGITFVTFTTQSQDDHEKNIGQVTMRFNDDGCNVEGTETEEQNIERSARGTIPDFNSIVTAKLTRSSPLADQATSEAIARSSPGKDRDFVTSPTEYGPPDIARLSKHLQDLKDAIQHDTSGQAPIRLGRTIKLIAASIASDPSLLESLSSMQPSEQQEVTSRIGAALQRLNEFKGDNLDAIIKDAGREIDYNPIRDELYALMSSHAPPTFEQQRAAQQTAVSTEGNFGNILKVIPANRTARICFVCTANFNRSPVMEIMAKHLLGQAGVTDAEISSFGLLVGRQLKSFEGTTNEELVEAARELGVSAEHRQVKAKAPTREQIETADVIITADEGHKALLVKAAQEQLGMDIRNKIIVFGELLKEIPETEHQTIQQELVSSGININLAKLATDMPDPIKGQITNREVLLLVKLIMQRAFVPQFAQRSLALGQSAPSGVKDTGPTAQVAHVASTHTPTRQDIEFLWRNSMGLSAYWDYISSDQASPTSSVIPSI